MSKLFSVLKRIPFKRRTELSKKIIKLVKETPNDADLGRKIRRLYLEVHG